MADVWKWLESASARKALKTGTVEEAYDICKEIIDAYNLRPRRVSQIPQDRLVPEPSSLCASCQTVRVTPLQNVSTVTGFQDTVPFQQAACDPEPHQQASSAGGLEGSRAESLLPNQGTVSATQRQEVLEGDIVLKDKLESLTKMASNDTNYFMLSSLFDDNMENNFGLCAGVCLDQCTREKEEPTKLMKEVLLYVHWKRFGIVDAREHATREEELRATLKVFEILRAAAGKRLYREMRWGFNNATT